MNIEMLVVEGITAVREQGGSDYWRQVACDPLFMVNLNILIQQTLPLATAIGDKKSVDSIYLLCRIVFEIGRLTGRSEIVRETMGE